MSRGAIEREAKIIFLQKRKSENRKSNDRKKEKIQKAKRKSPLETFVTGQTDRESKDAAIFPIRLAEKPGRTCYRNPGQLWDLGCSPVHLPVDASSLHEEIEPLVARRTTS
jgi:hypothetical protein